MLATLEASPGRTAKAVAGLAAITAAVLVALQTFLGHTQRGDRHQEAAMRYSQIQRELDPGEGVPGFSPEPAVPT